VKDGLPAALAAAWLRRPGAGQRARYLAAALPGEKLGRLVRDAGLACVALETAGELGLDDERLAALRDAARGEAARSLALEPALEEIAESSRSRGLQALLVKGLALDRGAYPHPGLRPASDLDLLVRRGEEPAWDDLLASLGYRPYPDVDRTWRRGEREGVDLHSSSSDLVGAVDVPEELSPIRLDLEGIFARAVEVPGLPLPAPGLEDHLILCAAHGLGVHLFSRTVWLLDAGVLLGRLEETSRLVELARASGAHRPLYHSLALAAAAGLIEPGGQIAAELRPKRVGRREARLISRLARAGLPRGAEFLLALVSPAPRGYRRVILRRALLPRRRTLESHGAGGLRGALRHAGRLLSLGRLLVTG
jgi:hypothetical protein